MKKIFSVFAIIAQGGTPMNGAELKGVLIKNLNDIIAAIALK